MSAVPRWKRFAKEDFPTLASTLGQDAEKLFLALNGFMQDVVTGFSKGLTFSANMPAELKTVDLTTAALPFSFKTSVQGAVGLVLVRAYEASGPTAPAPANIGAAVWPEWSQSGATITLKAIAGLSAGKTYRLTFLVFSDS